MSSRSSRSRESRSGKVDDLYGPTDSGYFFGINRSKRAIALDLKSEQGRAVLERLLSEADVMVVSMRPAGADPPGHRLRDDPRSVSRLGVLHGDRVRRGRPPG